MAVSRTLKIVFNVSNSDSTTVLTINDPDNSLRLSDITVQGGLLDTAKPVLGVSSIKDCYFYVTNKTELS